MSQTSSFWDQIPITQQKQRADKATRDEVTELTGGVVMGSTAAKGTSSYRVASGNAFGVMMDTPEPTEVEEPGDDPVDYVDELSALARELGLGGDASASAAPPLPSPSPSPKPSSPSPKPSSPKPKHSPSPKPSCPAPPLPS